MDSNFLKNLKSPGEIKALNTNELNELASIIRNELIANISQSGGHLASNLGIVELTLAIHKVFDSPDDKIVFDVGHQCYVHKMLTGRFNDFLTLRQKDGISGFPNPCESVHDLFKTGHSSTSISSALGLSQGMHLSGDNDSTAVAVIGDGSMTGGLAYEGLNNAGHSKRNIVVILNDNDMSISKNVGAISKLLTKMRNKRSYFKLKDKTSKLLSHFPSLFNRVDRFKSAVKSYFYNSNIFESLGFKYIGPIDGHNIELLTRVLKRAKSLKSPVLVHVKTVKGKGYSYAELQPHNFHGVNEFNVNTGAANMQSNLSFTDCFSSALVDIASKNDKVCAITAAMDKGCGLEEFKNLFPKRFFDVGIAESHAVTFAAGLAKTGKIPVFAVYSTFLQRTYDQIIHDISLQKLKVVFAVDRAGVVGSDGETHQGLFDIPMLLPVPNINIFAPATKTELDLFLARAINNEQFSSFIRYPKDNIYNTNDYPFFQNDQDYQILQKGSNFAIISYGREIFSVLDACKGKDIDIIKLNLLNTFDDSLLNTLLQYKTIIFVEECYENGGVGNLLSNLLYSKNYKGNFILRAIKNDFIAHCTQNQALCDCKLDSESILELIKGL